MDREIKFRGKTLITKKWKYGSLIDANPLGQYIVEFIKETDDSNSFPVKKDTVSQFTGFKDRNEKEIFEGDILSDWTETDEGNIQSKMQVFWCEKIGAWKLDNSFKQDKSSGDLLSDELTDFTYEITGNIYE